MDILCIAPAGARAGRAALPGSPRAMALESSTKIVAGTVPCLRPKRAHLPSLCSGVIPKGSLFPVAGVSWAGARCAMPGTVPTVRGWRCCGGCAGTGGAVKHRVPRHSLILAAGGSAGLQGAAHLPGVSPTPSQMQASHSSPASWSCGFIPISGSHSHGQCLRGRQEKGTRHCWGLGDHWVKSSPSSSSSHTLPRAPALGQAGVCTGQPQCLRDGAFNSVPWG